VLCDNFEGARIAVEHLITLGHRRIAFIGGPLLPDTSRPVNKIYTFERRATGYRAALLDAGLAVDYQLFESCNLTPDSAGEACKRLLEKQHDISAMFCANDEIAIGAMKALHASGYHIPEDISLVGFDNIHLVEHLTPALTTIRVNKEALGTTAVKRLLARFAEPESINVTSVLDVELITRNSTGPART
jgi:LacI family transcriptional regulator